MKVRKVSWSYSSATFHTAHIPYVLLYIIVGVCWGDCLGGGEGHGGSQKDKDMVVAKDMVKVNNL